MDLRHSPRSGNIVTRWTDTLPWGGVAGSLGTNGKHVVRPNVWPGCWGNCYTNHDVPTNETPALQTSPDGAG